MRRIAIINLVAALFLSLGVSVAGATPVLFDYLTSGGAANLSGFDTTTGLGSVTLTISSAGSHFGGLYVDHEIDEDINTFFNEYGGTSGSAPTGLSWEIDEPGFVYGNIYANFFAGSLDNGNGVPASAPDDVAMALGWTFDLLAGQTATLSFRLSEIAPTGGFYLMQYDPDSQETIYFTSALNITGGGTEPVPEPSTMLLLGAGLSGLAALGRKRMKK